MWDLEVGTKITEFKGHQGDIMSFSLTKDKSRFVTAACDSSAKVWDIASGKCTHTFEELESDLNSVAYFPDGQCFVVGADDSTCRLFDTRCYKELNNYTPKNASCGITSVDFSASGRYLFGGYDDFSCHIWDSVKAEELNQLSGHTNRISCLGVSYDGFALCTGSWDNLLKIFA